MNSWKGHETQSCTEDEEVRFHRLSIRRFILEGNKVSRILIHLPSFTFRRHGSWLVDSSITMTVMSYTEFARLLKCFTTGDTSVLRCTISDRWPLILAWSGWLVSPTSWRPHLLHVINMHATCTINTYNMLPSYTHVNETRGCSQATTSLHVQQPFANDPLAKASHVKTLYLGLSNPAEGCERVPEAQHQRTSPRSSLSRITQTGRDSKTLSHKYAPPSPERKIFWMFRELPANDTANPLVQNRLDDDVELCYSWESLKHGRTAFDWDTQN